jgi:hypothetical protein
MGEADATTFQLLGVMLQYDYLVEALAMKTTKEDASVRNLIGQLSLMKELVNLAEQQN